jgi:hypothetical protein
MLAEPRPKPERSSEMSLHPGRSIVPAALLATALASCAGTAASVPTATRARTVTTRHDSAIDRQTTAARATYANQVGGTHTLAILHQVGADPTLLGLLRSHQLAAARAYVAREFPRVWYHWHVSRLRITQGGHRVIETGVPFVVAPSQMVLRSGGRAVGTLQVSMQDEIGIVRLIHGHHPQLQVVIRGRTQLRTSMHAAAFVRLPATGTVRLGGRRYQVRSFSARSWEDGPVTVWILERG